MTKTAAQEDYRRIFLLSHMRAYSSLTGHILGSHPHINGYYEMHLSYTGPADLDRQLRRYRQSDTLKPDSRYLFDKLLHNDYTLDAQQLTGAGDRVLVSLRAPQPTLKSILHLFRARSSEEPYADPAQATAYYIQRLAALADFGRENPRGYYYFDAERLITDSPNLLGTLTQWCDLTPPLSDRYQTFALTGQPGAGDSSRRIASRKIQASENVYADIRLDAPHLRQAEQAYIEYRDELLRYARASMTAQVGEVENS